ncbi:hypothetical protein [Polaribacter sp. Hel1_85]|uniref:hypothetical protein n=1 Tax=Polaribacter sp. Hel1_85 TaxID=1250005 RepID=UPI00052DF29B|nr:hypothetical protein [Polaribacter sp. Hel1_85]KGL62017.1 hypothetical protein PHEL85_1804 [Polaribacter sp. Hel1_85]
MERHWKISDTEFEEQFSSNKFRPLWFSHEAHLRLAWIYITKYGKEIALEKYSKQLQDFANKYNAEGKYNATVTFASIQIINHFIEKSDAYDFQDFINEFSQLKSNFKEIIATYYSGDVFTSIEAKQHILLPDLKPFNE